MKTLVIYDSKFGNTARLAGVIAEWLGVAGPVRLASVEAAPFDFTGIDLLVIGGPTQLHSISPPLRALFEHLPRRTLDGVLAAAFDTKLPGSKLLTGAAAPNIGHWLKRMGARVVVPPESFLVAAREGPLVDGEWERAQTWADQVLAQAEASLPALVHLAQQNAGLRLPDTGRPKPALQRDSAPITAWTLTLTSGRRRNTSPARFVLLHFML